MTHSAKLGMASIVLLGGFAISPFMLGNVPFGWTFAILAALLGWLASRKGTKWWLGVPILVVAFTVFVALILFHGE